MEALSERAILNFNPRERRSSSSSKTSLEFLVDRHSRLDLEEQMCTELEEMGVKVGGTDPSLDCRGLLPE